MRVDMRHGTPLYLTADVRRIEARHRQQPLMARAGLAAAQWALEIVGDSGKPVLVFAGPGNNGGDAFVVARHLNQGFFRVCVVFDSDPARLPPDAAVAHAEWAAAGGSIVNAPPAGGDWGLVIDGLFGIGLTRDIAGCYAQWIAHINQLHAPVLALDIPSGLNADTGALHGCCVNATHTMTFIGAKPGLFTLDGPDHCGTIVVDDLDLEAAAAPGHLLGNGAASGVLAPRRRNSHKGSHGSVGIIGGDTGMVGATLLAARAALKVGAGRVYAGMLAPDAPRVDYLQPELMLRPVDEVVKMPYLSCLVAGPGLGQSPQAGFWLCRTLEKGLPLVLDADALNIIATDTRLQDQLARATTPKVLTPHPAEAARLLACNIGEVQANRVNAVQTLAERFDAQVVLKGTGSVCASPGRTWRINTSGNPGMASAGMGDVLTGIIAALLAQGADAQQALDAAVWLHGAAADDCVLRGAGPVGLTAAETIDAARARLNSAAIP
jgi:hydroxyethylthiazole kinase-like uncharacterized protein yjeF